MDREEGLEIVPAGVGFTFAHVRLQSISAGLSEQGRAGQVARLVCQ